MKHLKIFEEFESNPINESLTRYDYGIHKDNAEIDLFFDAVSKERYPFTEEESDIIWNILHGNVEMLDVRNEQGEVYFQDDDGLLYTIINLGDYCFSLFCDSSDDYLGGSEWESCEIFDGIEDMCEKLKTFK